MHKMIAPSVYLQGPGVLEEFGFHAKRFGKKFLVLAGGTAMREKKDIVINSFEKEGLICVFEKFNGEVTHEEVDRFADLIREGQYDCIIGMGGGKAIDAAKGVCMQTQARCIICPTSAATDAPCSSVGVFYDHNGHMKDYDRMATCPTLVLVDTKMIAEAPADLFVSGMGDALATYYESRCCVENKFHNPLKTPVSQAAFALTKACREALLKYGVAAKAAAEAGRVTPALEKVIEANIYLSGLGFENGGVAVAHPIANTLIMIPECHKKYHGQLVAFGLQTLLMLENRPKEDLDEVYQFCLSVGLPVCFEDINLTENVLEKITAILPEIFKKMGAILPEGTDEDGILDAMFRADAAGRAYRAAYLK